jgi:ATP-dependent DNA helicase RecG
MMSPLLDRATVEALAGAGESETVEFKKTTAEHERAAKTVCGMANQRGGVVLFGVAPDGRVPGQQVSERTLERLTQSLDDIRPHPSYTLQQVLIEGDREVLAVTVDRGADRPYRHRGVAFIRVGAVTQALSEERAQQITIEARHGSDRWETDVSTLTIDMLDDTEITRAVRDGVLLGRIPPDAPSDVVDVLQRFNLLDEGRLTNAAVALFARRDSAGSSYAQCQIRLGRFLGTDRLGTMSDDQLVRGGLFMLLRHATQFLADHLHLRAELPAGATVRVDTPEIPTEALREAIANALAHRDYTISGGVTVAVFDDRVEISSPGPLAWGISVERLLKLQESRPWNPSIADVMFRRGLIEAWGVGVGRMFQLTAEHGLYPPEIESEPLTTRITFTRPGHLPQRFVTGLTNDQTDVMRAIASTTEASVSTIVERVGRPRRTVQRTLETLADAAKVELVHAGRYARWRIVAH